MTYNRVSKGTIEEPVTFYCCAIPTLFRLVISMNRKVLCCAGVPVKYKAKHTLVNLDPMWRNGLQGVTQRVSRHGKTSVTANLSLLQPLNHHIAPSHCY